MSQASLFPGERLTLDRALDLTAESLSLYGRSYKHWALAFSGGKDSTACVTVVAHLLETGRVPRPESLTVLYADTRMELPALSASAVAIMDILAARGTRTKIVLPAMDDRFFVYLFGRGVPPPSNTFRWCTSQLKIEPMEAELSALREATGEKLLMLTGVRVGESAARDQRIAVSCSKNGGECGQGWFQQSTPASIADTLAPILHWRVCHVWDWLTVFAPGDGFPTGMIADAYGGDEARESDTRTGCVGCNLASRDVALERLIALPQWAYLAPLLELRGIYARLKTPAMRLRKDGTETRLDGSLVSNPQRLGPLTMDARRWGLTQILSLQSRVNANAAGRPEISLINDAEQARIEELMAANTWPRRWSGDEVTGDTFLPVSISRDGGTQFRLPMIEVTS